MANEKMSREEFEEMSAIVTVKGMGEIVGESVAELVTAFRDHGMTDQAEFVEELLLKYSAVVMARIFDADRLEIEEDG